MLQCVHRVRQLGQQAVTRVLEGNVMSRNEMEDEIEDLGRQALSQGFTSAQARPAARLVLAAWADGSKCSPELRLMGPNAVHLCSLTAHSQRLPCHKDLYISM